MRKKKKETKEFTVSEADIASNLCEHANRENMQV